MDKCWQVIATRQVRRFPWTRMQRETLVMYDGVTRMQATTLAAMLNQQDMGVTYAARAKAQKGQDDDRRLPAE